MSRYSIGLLKLLQSIAGSKVDLSTIIAPASSSQPYLLLNFPAVWCKTTSIFVSLSHLLRAKCGTAGRICSELVPQHTRKTVHRQKREASRQKSVHSILGKSFIGQQQDCAFITAYLRECQIWYYQWCNLLPTGVDGVASHYPPVTAYSIVNDKHGIRIKLISSKPTSVSISQLLQAVTRVYFSEIES